MLIPIPIGTKHTAIMEGSAPVLVLCEHCGLEYVYTPNGLLGLRIVAFDELWLSFL